MASTSNHSDCSPSATESDDANTRGKPCNRTVNAESETKKATFSPSRPLATAAEAAKVSKDAVLSARKRKKQMSVGQSNRPLSAYNFFFKLARDRLIEWHGREDQIDWTFTPDEIERQTQNVHPTPEQRSKRTHRKTHGKVGFQELAYKISVQWHRLPQVYRDMFQRRSDRDRQEQKQKKLAMMRKDPEAQTNKNKKVARLQQENNGEPKSNLSHDSKSTPRTTLQGNTAASSLSQQQNQEVRPPAVFSLDRHLLAPLGAQPWNGSSVWPGVFHSNHRAISGGRGSTNLTWNNIAPQQGVPGRQEWTPTVTRNPQGPLNELLSSRAQASSTSTTAAPFSSLLQPQFAGGQCPTYAPRTNGTVDPLLNSSDYDVFVVPRGPSSSSSLSLAQPSSNRPQQSPPTFVPSSSGGTGGSRTNDWLLREQLQRQQENQLRLEQALLWERQRCQRLEQQLQNQQNHAPSTLAWQSGRPFLPY